MWRFLDTFLLSVWYPLKEVNLSCGRAPGTMCSVAIGQAAAIGGRVERLVWPLNPVWGVSGSQIKVRPCQLMRHCTPDQCDHIWIARAGQDVTMVWSGCGFGEVALYPALRWAHVGSMVEQPWSDCEETSGLPVDNQHLVENGGSWGTGWCCFGRGLTLASLLVHWEH